MGLFELLRSIASTIRIGAVAPVPASDRRPEPKPPYLFVDLYPGDLNGRPNWKALGTTLPKGEVVGVILKASEGLNWGRQNEEWFHRNADALRSMWGEQLGRDRFIGSYHFLTFARPGKDQADYYCDVVERGGGWGPGSILPIVDVELGGEKHPNQRASGQQIVDCANSFATRIRERLGCGTILYGRGAMRDRQIRGQAGRMGCVAVWNPAYIERMPPMDQYGWPLKDIVLWQYAGDGIGKLPGYPLEIPGFGKVDLSVYVQGPERPTLSALRARLLKP